MWKCKYFFQMYFIHETVSKYLNPPCIIILAKELLFKITAKQVLADNKTAVTTQKFTLPHLLTSVDKSTPNSVVCCAPKKVELSL